MKTFLTTLLAPVLASAALLASAQAADVTVTLEGVRAGGDVYVALQTADEFMKEGEIGQIIQDTDGGEITLTFEDVPAGIYALAVWHDIDDDAVFDMQESGEPADGWAMSNQSELRGMPTFDVVQFTVGDDDVELSEAINYSN